MPQQPSPLAAARRYEREQAAAIPADGRPLFHLTPATGWMNDPNGFCYYNGAYHLFYQYHPYTTAWGPMHWGHAVSPDLLHWRHLPAALAPDTPADAKGCFSGSSLPLPDGRLLLLYTGVQPGPNGGPDLQMQCAAVGDGLDFQKDPANPVIHAGLLPPGYSCVDFRDPKIWHEDGAFYCVAVNRHPQDGGCVLLFQSPDAVHWRYLSTLDASRGQLGDVWECPDFFPLGGKQVLMLSPMGLQASAGSAFHPGNNAAALVGSYDKATHAFCRESVQPLDQGLDFYAPQTTQAPDGRRILVGWMANWDTCSAMPRRHRWFGRMGLPRELSLRGGRLCQQPVRELASLWRDTTCPGWRTLEGDAGFPGLGGRRLDLSVTLDLQASPGCRRFTLRFACGGPLFTEICYLPALGELLLDRSHCGFGQDLPHIRRLPVAPQDGRLTLRLVLDDASAELFVNDGEQVLSCLIDTPPDAQGVTLGADGPARLLVVQHRLG